MTTRTGPFQLNNMNRVETCSDWIILIRRKEVSHKVFVPHRSKVQQVCLYNIKLHLQRTQSLLVERVLPSVNINCFITFYNYTFFLWISLIWLPPRKDFYLGRLLVWEGSHREILYFWREVKSRPRVVFSRRFRLMNWSFYPTNFYTIRIVDNKENSSVSYWKLCLDFPCLGEHLSGTKGSG